MVSICYLHISYVLLWTVWYLSCLCDIHNTRMVQYTSLDVLPRNVYPLQNVLTTQGTQNTLHFQGGQYCLEIVIQPIPLSVVLFFKLFIKPTQLWFITRGGGRRDAPSCWRAGSCYPSDFRCHCWFISISFRTSLFTFLSN